MIKKILASILAIIMGCFVVACSSEKNEKGFADKSLALAKLIYEDFFIDLGEGDVYVKHFVPSKSGEPDMGYLWPYMEVASMCARLMTVIEPKTKIAKNVTLRDFYSQIVGGFKYYRSSRTDYEAYTASRASLPGFGTGDTYYDDNLWVALEYLNAYNLLLNEDGSKNEAYLNSAKNVTEFVLSGWDNEHGGIQWFNSPSGQGHPDYGVTRNTCSNAPTVRLCLNLYDITGNIEYFTWAERIYDFVRNNLMDVKDGTYYDNVKWNESKGKDQIEKTKWTYNSGMMITAGVMLYERTGDAAKKAEYLADAKKTAQGADSLFAMDMGFSARRYPEQPWFNVLMLAGFFDLYRVDAQSAKPYLDNYYDALAYGYDRNLDDSGYLSPDWVGGWGTGKNTVPKNVLDMAANSENFSLISYGEKELGYKR